MLAVPAGDAPEHLCPGHEDRVRHLNGGKHERAESLRVPGDPIDPPGLVRKHPAQVAVERDHVGDLVQGNEKIGAAQSVPARVKIDPVPKPQVLKHGH